MHGPIASVKPPGAAWLIDPEDELHAVRQRTTSTVVVSADREALEAATIPIQLPSARAWASAILAVLPPQAAALRLADHRQVDLDKPHGLNKITPTG